MSPLVEFTLLHATAQTPCTSCDTPEPFHASSRPESPQSSLHSTTSSTATHSVHWCLKGRLIPHEKTSRSSVALSSSGHSPSSGASGANNSLSHPIASRAARHWNASPQLVDHRIRATFILDRASHRPPSTRARRCLSSWGKPGQGAP